MSELPTFEPFLEELRKELLLYAGNRSDVIDEVRDHLIEAFERARRDGSTPDEAERRAIAAFGEPRQVGQGIVAQRSRRRGRILIAVALAAGLAMAYVDSRPTWDDTGVSALAVICASAVLGLHEPTRPWRWALAIGLWFPLLGILSSNNYGAFMALAIACAGAYGGSFVRRASVAN